MLLFHYMLILLPLFGASYFTVSLFNILIETIVKLNVFLLLVLVLLQLPVQGMLLTV